MPLQMYLAVAGGGAIGTAARFFLSGVIANAFGQTFPWGTLIINVTGSLVMGLIAGYFAFKGGTSQHWRLFLTTGILGGYTTFSTFSLDSALLIERGSYASAALYIAGSAALSIMAVFAGLWAVRTLYA